MPGVTVDRQCGSGQEAIHAAAGLVRLGQADVVLAGGVESASTAPWRIVRPRGAAPWPAPPAAAQPAAAAPVDPAPSDHALADPPATVAPAAPPLPSGGLAGTGLPTPYARAPFAPPGWPDPDMGPAAQAVADTCGVSRERQDAYALRSHERTHAHAADIAAELVPVGGVSTDERPRRLDPRVLARLPGAFAPGGSVTAGNSCGISDGAAAVAIITEELRARLRLPGLAILDWRACAGDPALPGIAPVPAVRALLERHDLTPDRIDAVEITEAFAAQVLACADLLGLDAFADDRLCGWGGAIAIGHPWGASGAALLVRLFSRLVGQAGPDGPAGSSASDRAVHDVGDDVGADVGEDVGERYGLATCAIGGGQGLALLAKAVGP